MGGSVDCVVPSGGAYAGQVSGCVWLKLVIATEVVLMVSGFVVAQVQHGYGSVKGRCSMDGDVGFLFEWLWWLW